jgi:uncharacterized protein (TIGR03083 family)
VVDRSDVAGLNPFDLYDYEAERVASVFLSLDEDGWAADTRCEGWRCREMLSHVAGVETYHLACLDDSIDALMAEAGAAGVTDMHSFNDWQIRIRAERDRDEIIDEWRTKNAEVRKRMRELGPDAEMSSSVGPYPVDLMGFHIASEYATHADDMGAKIPDSEKADRLAWRARVSVFAIKETEKPLIVERVADGYGISNGTAKSVLREDEFVEAVCGRLPADFSIDPELRTQLVSLA